MKNEKILNIFKIAPPLVRNSRNYNDIGKSVEKGFSIGFHNAVWHLQAKLNEKQMIRLKYLAKKLRLLMIGISSC